MRCWKRCAGSIWPPIVLLAQALRAQATDAGAQQRVGNAAPFGPAEQSRGGAVLGQFGLDHGVHCTRALSDFGNQGNSIGVVRW